MRKVLLVGALSAALLSVEAGTALASKYDVNTGKGGGGVQSTVTWTGSKGGSSRGGGGGVARYRGGGTLSSTRAQVSKYTGGAPAQAAAPALEIPFKDPQQAIVDDLCDTALPMTHEAIAQAQQNCAAPPAAAGGAVAAPPPPPPADVLGGQAVLQLDIPVPAPSVGPPPEVNRWNSAFVGYPLWLWSQDPQQTNATMTVQGYPVTLAGVRSNVTYDMGDGNTVTCATATPWSSAVAPAEESPDCGYRYTRKGRYTITATANWEVTWTALGQSGTIPVTKSATTTLPVGELQSVNVSAGSGPGQ